MALTPSICSINDIQGLQKDRTFHPSLWGDFFLTYQPPTAPKRAYMAERADVLKEEVRKMVKSANGIQNILDLILTLQRLGLDNHYENEIDELLSFVHDSDYDDKDLNLVSLRFYLLRKHGYDVSSDVFKCFQDKEGNFVVNGTKSLLSLYNAAYLRIPGEQVLDEAIIFTRGQLESVLDSLETTLADEVTLALQTPLFRRVRILETRNYIPIYEKEVARNQVILEFAKLNFNLLQLLYCEELKMVTLWWKQLNVETNLSFIRDRIVEMYFWMTGACSDLKYSLTRAITTKMTAYITILDDIMDTHSTTEEAVLLAEAIYRCEENAAELLPEYMKDFYLHLLKTFDSCQDELGPKRSFRVLYLKELDRDETPQMPHMKENKTDGSNREAPAAPHHGIPLCILMCAHNVRRGKRRVILTWEELRILVRGYSQEIKWRDEHYVPETIDEHLEVSRATVGAFQVACSSFVGMGDIIKKEILDWLLSYPELLKSMTTFVRLSNDIASTKREQTQGHHASTVQCYMLQHGTTIHDGCEKIKELIEDTWKDMMKLYLTPIDQPKVIVQTVLDFARTAEFMYKKTDTFTSSHTIKDTIALLFVEPILV